MRTPTTNQTLCELTNKLRIMKKNPMNLRKTVLLQKFLNKAYGLQTSINKYNESIKA